MTFIVVAATTHFYTVEEVEWLEHKECEVSTDPT
jgi:hypothetical protein